MRVAFFRMTPRNSRVVSGLGLRVFDQRLHVALNGSERRAQFVAHIGDKFAPRFLCGLNAGHVVQNGERAAAGQRRCVDLKDAPWRKRTGAAKANLAALERAAHAGQQLRVAHGVHQRAAQDESALPAMRCITALDQRT